MEPHEKKEFQRIIRLLKSEFPCKYPIKIRTKVLKRYHGLTGFYDGKEPYFLITIGKDRFDIMCMTLCHEVSHALSWNSSFNTKENPEYHTDKWSKIYVEVYKFMWKHCLTQA